MTHIHIKLNTNYYRFYTSKCLSTNAVKDRSYGAIFG